MRDTSTLNLVEEKSNLIKNVLTGICEYNVNEKGKVWSEVV